MLNNLSTAKIDDDLIYLTNSLSELESDLSFSDMKLYKNIMSSWIKPCADMVGEQKKQLREWISAKKGAIKNSNFLFDSHFIEFINIFLTMSTLKEIIFLGKSKKNEVWFIVEKENINETIKLDEKVLDLQAQSNRLFEYLIIENKQLDRTCMPENIFSLRVES